jgi:hypothetical protein
MKDLFIILFLLTSFTSFGQTCDTIEGKVFNCTDINGHKQGLWKEQRKILESTSYSGYGSKEGCRYSEKFRYKTLAEGLYSDNKKTGTWKYYEHNSNSTYVEREFTFNNNGTITEKNFIDNSVIEFSNDSTIIKGYIYHNGDTIDLAYSNKSGSFKLDKEKVILAFDCPDFNKFDYELLRLKCGMFDRKIRLMKLNDTDK